MCRFFRSQKESEKGHYRRKEHDAHVWRQGKKGEFWVAVSPGAGCSGAGGGGGGPQGVGGGDA